MVRSARNADTGDARSTHSSAAVHTPAPPQPPMKKLLFAVTKAHNVALSTPFYVTITLNHNVTFKTCLREPSPFLHLNGKKCSSPNADEQWSAEMQNTHLDKISPKGAEPSSPQPDSVHHPQNVKTPIHFPSVLFSYNLPSEQELRHVPLTVALLSSPKDEYITSSSCNIDTTIFLDKRSPQQQNGQTARTSFTVHNLGRTHQLIFLRIQLSPLTSMYIELAMTLFDETVHQRDYDFIQKLVSQNDLERVKYLFDGVPPTPGSLRGSSLGSPTSSSPQTSNSPLLSNTLRSNRFLKDYIFENVLEGNHTLLHIACERGYTKMVKYFLRDVAPYEHDIAIYDTARIENPFQAACRNKHVGVINFLLDSKEKYRLFDESLLLMQKNHRLYEYSRRSPHDGGGKFVSLLNLRTFKKVSVSSLNSSSDTAYFSPLHDACFRDDEKILKILLQKLFSGLRQSNAAVYNQLLSECMCLCSFVGSMKCLTILIQFGANVDGPLSHDSTSVEHAVPLYFACISRQTKVVSRLLERGAHIHYEPTEEEVRIAQNASLIKKAFPLLLCFLVDGMRSEFIVEIYKLYFKMQLNSDDLIDLMSIASLYCQPLFEEIARDKSLEPEQLSEVSERNFIHFAAQHATNEHWEQLMTHSLLSNNELLNLISTELGQTSLHIAAQFGNIASIKVLIQAGAQVNDNIDNREWTPLMTAIEYAQPCASKILFEATERDLSQLPDKYHLFLAILIGDRTLALSVLKNVVSLPQNQCLHSGPALFYCCTTLDSTMQDTQNVSVLHQIVAKVLLHQKFLQTHPKDSVDLLSFALKNGRDDMGALLVAQGFDVGRSLLFLSTDKQMKERVSQWSTTLLSGTSFTDCDFTCVDADGRGILHHIAETKEENYFVSYFHLFSRNKCWIGRDSHGHTPLHDLCRSPLNILPIVDRKIASSLLQLGDKPFVCDNSSHTAFYYALINRRFNICDAFISTFGVDCVLRTFHTEHASNNHRHYSTRSVLRELLDSDTRETNALIDAIEYFVFHKVNILSVGFDITQYCLQSKEILRLFMSTNDDALKRRDEHGNNPVHQIFGNGQPLSRDIIELLNKGGLLGALVCQRNNDGDSPLIMSCKDPRLRSCAVDIVEVADEGILFLNAEGPEGNTILHTLVERSDAELLDVILRLRAQNIDIHKVNPYTGQNAFGALLQTEHDNKEQIAGLLLRGGISLTSQSITVAQDQGLGQVLRENKNHWDISCLIKEGKFTQAQNSIIAGGDISSAEFNDDGFCAIHEAVQFKSMDLLKKLIDNGCNVNLCNGNGDTALHMAVAIGLLDIVRVLARLPKCDLNATNKHGLTPLQFLMLNRPNKSFNRTVQVLVEFGADVSVVDEQKRNVLHLFCHENTSPDTSVIAIVCKKNRMLLSQQDINGKTPLHYAVENDNFELVQKIASSKYTNLYLRDNDGNLPLDLAKAYRMKKAIQDRYMQGYLLKKAPKGVVRLSKRRWFVMQADYIRYLMSDGGELKGEIPMAEVVGAKSVDMLAFRFEILMRQSNRKYELQAENKASYERWMKAFEVRNLVL
mmetsp:Transcript_10056/g.37499  ORF Transcript_10056/g.37499 Transcript_10056/m.37499 type:complete len:1553 (-) Transcript_10056:1625-6283(-)